MKRSTIVALAIIAIVAAYVIPRDNKKKDADFAWARKSFKMAPTIIAKAPHAYRT